MRLATTTAMLSNIPLFNELDTAQLEQVAQGVREISCTKGRILFNKGDKPDGFYVVLEGRIKLSFISSEGKEYIAEMFGPGQSFGEAVMFLDKQYPVCARALKDCKIIHISKSVIVSCIERNSGVSRKIIAGLCVQLIHRVQALEYLTIYSSIQKVVGYLLSEIEWAKPVNGEVDLMLSVSKATIASQLNLTPETLSRVLHKLGDEGLVRIEGKMIHICDIERLRVYNG